MSTVITVEYLGKKYTISHQQRGDNSSLREVITNGVASLGKKLLSPFTLHHSQASPSPFTLHDSPASEDFWALKDVSFEVKQGERIGIIGRNGAGKSTLLKILSRITEPTTGRVKIKGRVASLLEVGTGFHPELTGRENIYLNGAILGMGRQEISRKFDEIVAFAEIEKFLDTPVKRYSSGMYVRLAFAVAAHLEPEILIVDEVLAVGDAQFQKKCLGKMEEVGNQGRTVLFVSHNLSAVSKLCPKSIVLNNGEMFCYDTTTNALLTYTKLTADKHNFTDGVFELYDRVNSYGTELIIKSIALRDKNNAFTTSVLMGGVLNIEFIVENLSDHHGADLGITIKNSTNQWLTSFNTAMVKPVIISDRSFRELVTLELSNIRLTPGMYDFDLSVAKQGIGRLDYVENAGYFEVIESDVYGTGYNVTSYFGVFFSEGKWFIRGNRTFRD